MTLSEGIGRTDNLILYLRPAIMNKNILKDHSLKKKKIIFKSFWLLVLQKTSNWRANCIDFSGHLRG